MKNCSLCFPEAAVPGNTETMLYDQDIREPLYLFLEKVFGKVRFLEEKNMGRSRADAILVLPAALCGIEIKSDADTYTRLSRQVQDYDRYYDYNLLVIGQSHAMHAAEHIPDFWGILTVSETEEGICFQMNRIPQKNPNCDLERKLSILWRPELNHLLERNRMPHYTQKSKRFVAQSLLRRVPPALLHVQISEELYERDYTRIGQVIADFRNAHRRSGVRRSGRRKRSRVRV